MEIYMEKNVITGVLVYSLIYLYLEMNPFIMKKNKILYRELLSVNMILVIKYG